MVHDAIDGGERHGLIGEDFSPFAEGLICGDEQGSALVSRADQFEQNARRTLSRVFPGGNRASSRCRSKRRRFRSTISCSARAARNCGGGPAFLVGGRRQGGPDQLDAGQSQLAEQQVDASGVDLVGRLHAASPTLVAI